MYRSPADPTRRPLSGTGKSSKWQPLSSVDPSPVADTDPFSLDDSDDEKDNTKEMKADDPRRMRKATAEARTDDIGSASKQDIAQHDQTGGAGPEDKETENLAGKH